MRTYLISITAFASLLWTSAAAAQTVPDKTPQPPAGWTCVDKVSPKGQKFKLCTPPTGVTSPPMHFWVRGK